MAPYVRTAIQLGVAVAVAIALGDVLSGQRFYWAVIGAFVVFQGTSNTEEQVSKAFPGSPGRSWASWSALHYVNLIGMHAAWTIVVILASVLLGLYLQRADYAFLVIGITVMVSQLYEEFGDYSSSLLVQRLEETTIGAAVAAAVVLVVLPLRASRVARVALLSYLTALASLLQDAYGALGGAENAALRQGDTPGPERRLPGPGVHHRVNGAAPGRRPEPAGRRGHDRRESVPPPRSEPAPRYRACRRAGRGHRGPAGPRLRNPAGIADRAPVRRRRIAPGKLHPLGLPV